MMPTLDTSFRPNFLLRQADIQTVIQSVLGRGQLRGRMERLSTPDDDFIEVLWIGQGIGPIVILLPGLGGSAWSPYAIGMSKRLASEGYRVAVLHARGCGTQPNRLPTAFHSGQTEDLAFFIDTLRHRQIGTPLYAVGFSLGANVLLKSLAESDGSQIAKAAAISPPLDLAGCARRLTQGSSQAYQRYLLNGLHRMLREKRVRTDIDELLSLDDSLIASLNTIELYDDRITAPLHGFGTKERYYSECSSGAVLGQIKTKTMVLSSIDDPFLDPKQYDTLPSISPTVSLRITRFGGHVGFIQSVKPRGTLVSWAEDEVVKFFA